MRTHSDIIRDAGGAQALHAQLGLARKLNTVRSWVQRGSIPAKHWRALADRGFATVDELATGAATRTVEQRAA